MGTHAYHPEAGEVNDLIYQIETQLDGIRKGVLAYQLKGKTQVETEQCHAITTHLQTRITDALSGQIIQILQVEDRDKVFREILSCFGLPVSDWNK